MPCKLLPTPSQSPVCKQEDEDDFGDNNIGEENIIANLETSLAMGMMRTIEKTTYDHVNEHDG